MKIRGGFTLVEMVIIVAVIAVLITISAFGISKVQQSSRDAIRESNALVIAEALEKYYDKNASYPGCISMTASATAVSVNTLIGIDRTALVTPNAENGITNSIQCNDTLTSDSNEDYFAYVVDSSTGCQTGNSCPSWSLKYKLEETQSIGIITSRR